MISYRLKIRGTIMCFDKFVCLIFAALVAATGGNLSAAKLTAEQTFIVDCLLPGKVRQLGINRTYLSRKRPMKASANECEILGGDYVKYDRADFTTSLNVWQQAASSGDAEAQYFVGEIFEKGMGQEPDYQMALLWYQRAAKQSFQPAKMSMGRLYELGLGVEKDLVKAMNLYRQASGLEGDEIEYASVFENIKQQDAKRIDALQAQLKIQKNTSYQLQQKLQRLRNNLQKSADKTDQLEDQIQLLKEKVGAADNSIIQSDIENKQIKLDYETQQTTNLRAQLDATLEQLNNAKQRIRSLSPNAKPTIALKWPKFKQIKGMNTSLVASGSIVNVVGAVRPFANVKSFTINGKDYELDANGLFLKSIDVGREPVKLVVKVENELGETTVSELTVKPSSDINVVLRGVGALTKPKFDFGSYHALVIGNNNYDLSKGWDPLDTAENDARAIADVLKNKYGFNVRLELNADRDTMLMALEEMRKKLTSDDNLLVYYAGHGLIDPENDQGYWVPVDGTSDSAVRWVSNASITDQIRAMTARNVMVIADSCYSASLMRSGIVTLRSGLSAEKKVLRLGEDVKQLTRVALSSGGLQPVADSIDNSRHSVFASALLGVLNNNNELLDADSLATQVAHTVAVATKDSVKQVPRYAPLAAGGHQGGEFYFAPKNIGLE